MSQCNAMSHALCWCQRVKDPLQMGQTCWVKVSAPPSWQMWMVSVSSRVMWSIPQHHLPDVHRVFLATWADNDNDNDASCLVWSPRNNWNSGLCRGPLAAAGWRYHTPIPDTTPALGQWELCLSHAVQLQLEVVRVALEIKLCKLRWKT